MLDRRVVREFLAERLKGAEIPEDVSFEELVEVFSACGRSISLPKKQIGKLYSEVEKNLI